MLVRTTSLTYKERKKERKGKKKKEREERNKFALDSSVFGGNLAALSPEERRGPHIVPPNFALSAIQ